jgi:hypothetical protein
MPLAPANRARLHAVLACTGIVIVWWRFPSPLTWAMLALASVLALIACFAPGAYVPIQRGLDAFTRMLLMAVTWALLAVVYFGLFTPLRIWRLLIGKDPLNLGRSPLSRTPSYLQPSPAASRFERQF